MGGGEVDTFIFIPRSDILLLKTYYRTFTFFDSLRNYCMKKFIAGTCKGKDTTTIKGVHRILHLIGDEIGGQCHIYNISKKFHKLTVISTGIVQKIIVT